jgi:hypothetical protein
MNWIFSEAFWVIVLFTLVFGYLYIRDERIDDADGYLFEYVVFYPMHNDTITAYTKNDCRGCGEPNLKVSSYDGTNYIAIKGNNHVSNTAPLKIVDGSIRPTHDKPFN